jgi:hypothetical protein
MIRRAATYALIAAETIRVVDLKKAVAAANGQIRTIKMESEQPIVDGTTFMSGKQASDAEQ